MPNARKYRPRGATIARDILASTDKRGRFHTATNHASMKPERVPVASTVLMRTATLDLGASKADRNWSMARPGKIDPDTDTEYRDVMGPIRGDGGCTVKSLDFRKTGPVRKNQDPGWRPA